MSARPTKKRFVKIMGMLVPVPKPVSRMKLASELSDAVSLMRGYAGHHGSIDRYHPLMCKVTDANRRLMQAFFAFEERKHRRKRHKK